MAVFEGEKTVEDGVGDCFFDVAGDAILFNEVVDGEVAFADCFAFGVVADFVEKVAVVECFLVDVMLVAEVEGVDCLLVLVELDVVDEFVVGERVVHIHIESFCLVFTLLYATQEYPFFSFL